MARQTVGEQREKRSWRSDVQEGFTVSALRSGRLLADCASVVVSALAAVGMQHIVEWAHPTGVYQLIVGGGEILGLIGLAAWNVLVLYRDIVITYIRIRRDIDDEKKGGTSK